MKNSILFLLISFSFCASSYSQIIFEENFESGQLPAGFTIETNAPDNGWNVGSAQALSSAYFGIQSNGSSGIIATNDDGCNCDKSMDRLILPVQDFTAYSALSLNFDSYFVDGSYQGAQEQGLVQVSIDGTNWITIEDVHGHGSWDRHRINISDLAGEPEVYISFLYQDNGGWLFGMAVDNISIEVPVALEAELVELDAVPFLEIGNPLAISGTISNNGAETIREVELSFSINGSEIASETLNINTGSFTYSNFELATTWTPDQEGEYTVLVKIESVNGTMDNDLDNNEQQFTLEVFPRIERINMIKDIMDSNPVFTTVATSADQLFRPTDLDFHPVLAKDELWIVNERTENQGGSTLTIYDASTDVSDMWLRVDGNAWHFMSLPTGIAFSPENYNFATSPGVLDANHQGGSFTGPTLWSSDPEIYAQPSGGNGSHLDMLHGSPYSMGIAHEVDNVFWVYDNFNKSIVRYDFVEDHGPGNDDHSDAIVRRFNNTGINADGSTPNHMILDKETGWLYVVDNGNDRVFRLDINSGTSSTTLGLINEPLAEHSAVNGFTTETIIEGLDKPCGIDLIDNLLLVGEYQLGDIVVYDMDNNFEEVGRIYTDAPGLAGIKIGPDGSIWYCNYVLNTVNRIEMGESTSTEELLADNTLTIYPNPASSIIELKINDLSLEGPKYYDIYSINGAKLRTGNISSLNTRIQISDLESGTYLLKLFAGDKIAQKKFIVK